VDPDETVTFMAAAASLISGRDTLVVENIGFIGTDDWFVDNGQIALTAWLMVKTHRTAPMSCSSHVVRHRVADGNSHRNMRSRNFTFRMSKSSVQQGRVVLPSLRCMRSRNFTFTMSKRSVQQGRAVFPFARRNRHVRFGLGPEAITQEEPNR
jgi:hypothetical protein